MTSDLSSSSCRSSSPAFKGLVCLCWLLCAALSLLSGVHGAETPHAHVSTLSVTTPHLIYTCPEGATVRLVCAQAGAKAHPQDVLRHSWLYTPHHDQQCHQRVGPRGANLSSGHGGGGGHAVATPGVKYGAEKEVFWVELENVTHAQDQGRYCCMLLDYQLQHGHGHLLQKTHSHVILTVTPRRNGSLTCTYWDPKPPEGTWAAVLATAACVMALLSVPLILLMVYKHRHSTQSSRRAHELVRMDSTALGHENPVFMGGSPQVKSRTVSEIMTRQPSETGRHLLSESATPLSPPGDGNVFFPSHDSILEDPDFLQV